MTICIGILLIIAAPFVFEYSMERLTRRVIAREMKQWHR